MACISCGRGFYNECRSPDENGNPCGILEVSSGSIYDNEAGDTRTFAGPRTEGLDWQKSDNDILDPKSTGRKRAAKLYPLDREAPCEWRGLKFAGGNKPIVGCANGLQRQRHHGPNKDTLDNAKGNVHRICDDCHARWHTLNDEGYSFFAEQTMPHDAETFATTEELAQNEIYWRVTRAKAPGGGKQVHD